MVAYVYLLTETPHESENSGPWTKIGFSKNHPEWRMNANLKRGNPRTLFFGAVYEYETEQEARKIEKAAHERFHKDKHQKEWFSVRWEDVAAWFDDNGHRKRTSKPTERRPR